MRRRDAQLGVCALYIAHCEDFDPAGIARFCGEAEITIEQDKHLFRTTKMKRMKCEMEDRVLLFRRFKTAPEFRDPRGGGNEPVIAIIGERES